MLGDVVQVLQLTSQRVFVLEDDVGEGVSQFGGEDADAGSCQHVAHPVAVVHHAKGCDAGGYCVAAHAEPGAACQSVLLVQDGGSHEGRGGVAGGEGVGCGAVGAFLASGIFDAVHDACHDGA